VEIRVVENVNQPEAKLNEQEQAMLRNGTLEDNESPY